MLSGSSLSRSTVLISKEKGTSEGVVVQLVLCPLNMRECPLINAGFTVVGRYCGVVL